MGGYFIITEFNISIIRPTTNVKCIIIIFIMMAMLSSPALTID